MSLKHNYAKNTKTKIGKSTKYLKKDNNLESNKIYKSNFKK